MSDESYRLIGRALAPVFMVFFTWLVLMPIRAYLTRRLPEGRLKRILLMRISGR